MEDDGSQDRPPISPLSGIRILDFSQYLAGPIATMLLADFGADVIRIDPPGGPRWQHPANACLHRNKRSMVLDLKEPRDLATARTLIGTADVVVEGFRPGVMARLGLDPEAIRAAHPLLIWCALPGFPSDDPRADMAAWEGVVCAAAGLYPDSLYELTGGPMFSALPYASNFAGLIAAHSIVAALISRTRYGHGDQIEVASFNAAAEVVAISFEDPQAVTPADFTVPFSVAGIRNPAENRLYRCRDGRFLRREIPLRGLHALWDLHMPEGLKDDDSPEAQARAETLLEALFLTKNAAEWERIGQKELRAAYAAHLTSEEWMEDRHAIDSHSVVMVDDPEYGPITIPGVGVKVNGSPAGRHRPRRPTGEDTEVLRQEAAVRAADTDVTHSPLTHGGAVGRPLDGIRVADFSSLFAGPTAGRILAQYGAEVIKVARTSVALGKANLLSDEPFAFVGHRTTGLGKKSVFLDLGADEAPEIMRRLARTCDVLHHNFTMEAAERYGLTATALEAAGADCVCSSVRAHGTGGWREGFRGHEQIAQATTGMTIRFGSADAPLELKVYNNDFGTAHLSALGILLALFQRRRGGRALTVEAALSRTATLSQIPYMIDASLKPWNDPSGPAAVGWTSFNRLFRCSDGWMFVAAIHPADCRRLIGFAGLDPRTEQGDEAIAKALETLFASRSASIWCDELRAAGISAHPYVDLATLSADPGRIERGLIVDQPHPGLKPGRTIGAVARFRTMPSLRPHGAVRPGMHTSELLSELGYGTDEVAALIDKEVVAGPMGAEMPFAPS